jgi:xanthine dehydrogenase accessory factor
VEQFFDVFCETYLKLHREGVPMVVVTMTDYRGSAPQDPGARMIVGESGILFGTVGGGKIEKKCLDVASELLLTKRCQAPFGRTWNLQRDIGMSCGGEVTMFFESHVPSARWHVAIFGAGHVSQELTRLLLKLDCQLTVVDPRQEWLDKLPATHSSRVRYVCATDMAQVLDELSPDTFVALMTMGHASDMPILKRALNEFKFPFLGVIGSAAKRNRLEAELGRKDFHCPLGEDFGNNAPMEIALSMVAQLMRERDRIFSGARSPKHS